MLTQNPAEMTGYSSLYPGVDHLPNRLPHLDRYGHAWCIVCHGRNGRAVAGDGLCDTCRGQNHANPEHRRIAYGHGITITDSGMPLYTCPRCSQVRIPPRLVESTERGGVYTVPPVCDSCREQDRESQGESMRLFEPAPNQIPGQLRLG